MKFLIISSPKHPFPPEAVSGLMDAMVAWVNKYTESGKFEATWTLAGQAGGGAIVNVDSLEELDGIMIEFPFGPFAEVEVHAIVDIIESLQRAKQAAEAMAQAMG